RVVSIIFMAINLLFMDTSLLVRVGVQSVRETLPVGLRCRGLPGAGLDFCFRAGILRDLAAKFGAVAGGGALVLRSITR
ncbi:MAG: hypothetical protein K0U66_09085, partial [Gammaproteobacteria bacterium]|nr:hypothetical protein [Gammaproteobacteria bacterium]